MYYYCQYLTGSSRGLKKIVTDGDFKHPLQVSTPDAVNKNLKYKVLGDDKQYWYAGILFVAETLAKVQHLIDNERPRFNSKYLQSDSSSSDVNIRGPKNIIDKSLQNDRYDKIQQAILQKQEEVRAKRKELPFKTPLPNAKHIETIGTRQPSNVPKKKTKVSQKNEEKKTKEQRTKETLLPNLQAVASANQTMIMVPKSIKTILPRQNAMKLKAINSSTLQPIISDINQISQKPTSSSASKDPSSSINFKQSTSGKSDVHDNPLYQTTISSGKSTAPFDSIGLSEFNVCNYEQNEAQTLIVEKEKTSSTRSTHCQNKECNLRLLRSEETISNLTKLLDQQLKIVDELHLEVRDLRYRKEELHHKLENKHEEFQARLFEDKNKTATLSPFSPAGFVRKSDNHIHLGRGIWLPLSKYNDACNVNSPSLFVKFLCDMIFTFNELKESTLSGNDSNRKKGTSRNPKKLDPTKVLAIKDITKYWLETLNYSDEAVDIEVNKVRQHIASKIAELNRNPNRRRKLKHLKGIDEDGNIINSSPENNQFDGEQPMQNSALKEGELMDSEFTLDDDASQQGSTDEDAIQEFMDVSSDKDVVMFDFNSMFAYAISEESDGSV